MVRIGVLAKLAVLAVMFGLFIPASARAEQGTDERVQRLEAAVAELQAELAALKAARAKESSLAVDPNRLEQLVNKAFEKRKGEIGTVPDWVKNVKISGDFMYRHETINSKTSTATNRNRIRARLGLDVKVNDEWDLGFRFATGASDATSTQQTLESGFQKKSVWLDMAYFDWHPKTVKNLNVYGGKMPLPFYRAGSNQLVWDSDVNPEGLAAAYSMPFCGENNTLYINGGGFWLKADTGEGSSSSAAIWGIQSYLKHNFENKNYLLGGMSYYAFTGLEGKDGLYKASGTGATMFGNTMSGAGTTASPYKYMMNYNVLEGFTEYGFKLADKPASVYGSYVKNTAATTSENSAWIAGVTFNKAKEPKSWELGYSYRVVEADAALGVLTDSDIFGGGTDGKGHQLSGKYQLTKNIQAGLTYFLSQKGDNNDAYRRLQADLLFKF